MKRVSIITGGAVGIGFAIAERLARRGDNVVLVDVDRDSLDKAVTALQTKALAATGLQLDLLGDDFETEIARVLRSAPMDCSAW